MAKTASLQQRKAGSIKPAWRLAKGVLQALARVMAAGENKRWQRGINEAYQHLVVIGAAYQWRGDNVSIIMK